MKLNFKAREDLIVREAGVMPRIGEATRYYGRHFDPAARAYPANEEAFSVESGSEDGDKCSRQCRKGALFAADKETADAIGVKFVETEFKDGAHTVKSAPAPKPAPVRAVRSEREAS